MSGKLVVVKKVPNAILYEGGVIKLINVRASYPHLAEPYKGDGENDKPSFGIVGLLPHGSHKEAALLVKEAIDKLAKESKLTVAKDKRCLRNGDDGDKEEAFGHYTVSARENKRPKVRGLDNQEVPKDEIEELIYGGCYVDILIRLWAQDNKFGKRINANLVAVRFRKDGEAFGEGRINDEEAWDDEESDGGGFDDDEDDI